MYLTLYLLPPKKTALVETDELMGTWNVVYSFLPCTCDLLAFTQHLHISKALYQHLLILTTSL